MGRSLARKERLLVTNPQTNLRVLKPSRKKPQPGDIFAMQPADELFLFGQVVLADFYGPMPSSYLIYVYDKRSTTRDPDLRELTPDGLLIPPIFINKMPWTKGYFETVAHRDLATQVLQQHRFRDWNGKVVDENGVTCTDTTDLVGQYALSSYRWLDDHVSDALGIPKVPEDD